MKVATLDSGNPLEDGTFATETTSCPKNSKESSKLPSVQQLEKHWTWQKRQWTGKNCYLIGRATITAGTYFCTDCIMSPANYTEHSATCQVDERNSTIQRDLLTNLSLDFMPEMLKYSTMLNFTSAYTKRGADQYVIGMLRLGYHADWSSMRRKWDFGREEARLQAAQTVVRADIDFIRLYVWLAMNATLELAAIAVYPALLVCKVKTVRDTTIAALTMDLGDVMHGAKGRGLCNAASSGKEDRHLPPLRWKGKKEGIPSREWHWFQW
ncbi:hypothetical protein BS50DRAFT_594251 [Corynespora cassiicola Philippines]|uniref:Uncharacterized protein n=1 Tax=Corynespora cassiicola Philippines TaxID=1448308 RepID=A0A2T2N325_CORCC|nr:hypothetical protein BS50DRAFT_594251 [Corynespora cassiicola Philippines]